MNGYSISDIGLVTLAAMAVLITIGEHRARRRITSTQQPARIPQQRRRS